MSNNGLNDDSADWGDDDDDFLCEVDWDREERRMLVARTMAPATNHVTQHVTNSNRGHGLTVSGDENQGPGGGFCDTNIHGQQYAHFASQFQSLQRETKEQHVCTKSKENVCDKVYISMTLLPPTQLTDGSENMAAYCSYPFVLFYCVGNANSVVSLFENHCACAWDVKKKGWKCPASEYESLVKKLAAQKNVHIDVLHAIAASVIKVAIATRDDSLRYCYITESLETHLMPFQREGVKFALRHGGRCLLGDEMGLGKTVQALAIASAYRDEWPVLVIAPSSLRESWSDAIQRWLGIAEGRIFVVNCGKDAEVVPHGGLDFLVVSYNFLDKMELEGKYNVVVVDESHYLKDSTAKRTKAALPILKSSKRCILLTGTPALNRPKEIFTQLSGLLPKAHLKMKDFGERYCSGNRFDKYGGAKNLEELHALLRGSVMIRRLKSSVLSELPKKRRQQIFLSLDSTARKELDKAQQQLQDAKSAFAQMIAQSVASGVKVNTGVEEKGIIMEVYKKTAELKVKAVQEYIDTLLDGGGKFLVFAHHTVLLDAVEHCCNRKKGIKYIRIDGATPASIRSKLVDTFQTDEQVRVAILSIRAAGVGLTLTAASTVVFAEMTWTPGEIIQAEDRAHRIGQNSSVNVYFLHIKNSIDDVIWNSIQSKLENLGQTLDGRDQNLDVSQGRTIPERGQQALEKYFTSQSTQKQDVIDLVDDDTVANKGLKRKEYQ